MKPHLNYTLEDLLKDDDFIRYTFCDTPLFGHEWNALCRQSADFQQKVVVAQSILRRDVTQFELTPAESGQLKNEIFRTLMI